MRTKSKSNFEWQRALIKYVISTNQIIREIKKKLPNIHHSNNKLKQFSVCVFFIRYRLAALELAKFQDQLIKRLVEDMYSQLDNMSPSSTGAIMVSSTQQQQHQHQLTSNVVYDYDWTFARAFLYSLTILTTIGELF